MNPFIFILKVAIPKNGDTVYREFVFIDRKEAEIFRTHVKLLGAHVTDLKGVTPYNSNMALRRVADEIEEQSVA
jgi:hypothetical protein